jgi:putative nucleotidyltransferase with HDIG domain
MANTENKGEASKPQAASPTPSAPVPKPEVKAEGASGPAKQLGKRLSRNWKTRVANLTILSFMALACAYLLTPGLFSPRIPYGEESVGQFSSMVIKANRDYDIPDEETTRRKREEAAEAVLPIYDYDVTVADSAVERVRSAFELMQQAARSVDEQFRAEDPAERAEDARKARPARKTEEVEAAVADAFKQAFRERREEWQRRLETHLDDESFEAFAQARFSVDGQHETQKLVMRANGQRVAEYRDPLALSGGRGILVRRRSGGDAVGEQVVKDVSPIHDQSEIRAEVGRWAADLPAEMPVALRKAITTLVARQIRANLRFNREETEERRRLAAESVKPVVIQLKKGEKIIGDGERIEHRHLVIFAAISAQTGSQDGQVVRVGGGLFALLLTVVVYGFARASLRRFRPTRKDALLGALMVVLMLGLVNLSITISDAMHDRFPQVAADALYFAAPFAAGAMLIRFVLGAESALVFALVFSGFAGVVTGNSLEFGLYALVGSLVASAKVARANDRAALFSAGVYAGLANAFAVVCLALLNNKLGGWNTAAGALAGFVGGALFVPMLVMGITPLVEAAFGYTTDIKLLELANLNHPALKELIVQAPGTYHHSIIIGSLVEAAAEAIGANPLLARVCAYYHDIGKGKNPLYFGENQRGENKHNKLAPQMSALIIKRHVTDGMEMARHYKLPKAVADAIPQHHGTRLVAYFYHKALKEQEGKPDPQPIDDSLYRYPGPKPQFREAALVMIADAVEASSRAMQDPTPAKLQALVQKIINNIFVDGQLDECDLTLRDLNEIARSFFRILGGIYHTRPDYPAQALQAGRPALSEVKDGGLEDARQEAKPPLPEIKRAQNER